MLFFPYLVDPSLSFVELFLYYAKYNVFSCQSKTGKASVE